MLAQCVEHLFFFYVACGIWEMGQLHYLFCKERYQVVEFLHPQIIGGLVRCHGRLCMNISVSVRFPGLLCCYSATCSLKNWPSVVNCTIVCYRSWSFPTIMFEFVGFNYDAVLSKIPQRQHETILSDLSLSPFITSTVAILSSLISFCNEISLVPNHVKQSSNTMNLPFHVFIPGQPITASSSSCSHISSLGTFLLRLVLI